MARILCVWELGDDLGHIAKFSQVTRMMIERGHEVFFAAKDLSRIESFDWHEDTHFIQAPVWLGRLRKPVETNCLAEIFFYKGFEQPNVLRPFVKAWIDIFKMVQPDLFIVDHSPTTLLAASALNIPKVILSNCFVCPPPGSYGIDLRPWDPKTPEHIETLERHVANTINTVAASLVLPSVRHLSDLYSVDKTIFPAYPELDPYSSIRKDAIYIGAIESPSLNQIPEWRLSTSKVFAYLKYGHEKADPVLQALTRIGANTVCFYAGLPPALRQQYQSPWLTVSEQPFDVDAAILDADVIVCHAGLGMVSSCLAAGKPMILIPTQLEQRHTSIAIEKMRTGIMIDKPDTAEIIDEKFKSFFSDPLYRENARFFSYSNKHLKAANALNLVGDMCESLLPPSPSQ